MNFAATGLGAKLEFKDLPLNGFGNVTLSAADFGGCLILVVVPMNAALEINNAPGLLLTTGAVAAGCSYTDWQQIGETGSSPFITALTEGINVDDFIFTGGAVLTFDLLNPFNITGVRVFFIRLR